MGAYFVFHSATKDTDSPMGGAVIKDNWSDDGNSADWGWGDDDVEDAQVEMGSLNESWSSSPHRRTYSPSPSSPQSRALSHGSGSGSPMSLVGHSTPSPTNNTVPKGMRLGQPSLNHAPASTTPLVMPPRKAPAPAPPQGDIFAELGLAAHPTFPHHHQHQQHVAPSPSSAPQRRMPTTTATMPSTWRTTATAAAAPAATAFAAQPVVTTVRAPVPAPLPAAASDPFDDDDAFKDDWGDNDDLDDLLND